MPVALNLKEISVLNNVVNHPNLSQREIAQMSRLSIGLTNGILGKLVKKGHLKIVRVSESRTKKIIPLPQALSALGRHFFVHVVSVAKIYNELLQLIHARLEFLINDGYEDFIILHESDEVAELVRCYFKDNSRPGITLRDSITDSHAKSVLIRIGSIEIPINFRGRVIDLLSDICFEEIPEEFRSLIHQIY